MTRYIDVYDATKRVIENSTDEDRFKLVLAIADCPTADVREVKHGRWLYCRNNDYEGGTHTAECGNCRITQSVVFYQRKPIFKYCPHCGAIMDGDQK